MLKGLKKVLILRAIKNSFRNRRSRNATINQGLWTLGGIGVGVGLMYLLDPDLGHRRRSNVREKIARGVGATSKQGY